MIKKKKINILYIAVVSIVLIVASFILFSISKPKEKKDVKEDFVAECSLNEDCVPSTCCHPNSCVPKSHAPNCSEVFCTMECKPNTMDCGAGSCVCLSGKCKVKWKNEER